MIQAEVADVAMLDRLAIGCVVSFKILSHGGFSLLFWFTVGSSPTPLIYNTIP